MAKAKAGFLDSVPVDDSDWAGPHGIGCRCPEEYVTVDLDLSGPAHVATPAELRSELADAVREVRAAEALADFRTLVLARDISEAGDAAR